MTMSLIINAILSAAVVTTIVSGLLWAIRADAAVGAPRRSPSRQHAARRSARISSGTPSYAQRLH
jgi:uncharacterized iron-regulated membrane protein